MMKVISFLTVLGLSLSAATFATGDSVNRLSTIQFEDVNEKVITISKDTQIAIAAFEKDTNTLASGFFNAQEKDFLTKNSAVYITDIHKMPSIISYLFAYPKMKKYIFPFYIYNQEGLENTIAHQEEKITVVFFENGVVSEVKFITTEDELKTLFEKCAKGRDFKMK
jgi:hypothetical protein